MGIRHKYRIFPRRTKALAAVPKQQFERSGSLSRIRTYGRSINSRELYR